MRAEKKAGLPKRRKGIVNMREIREIERLGEIPVPMPWDSGKKCPWCGNPVFTDGVSVYCLYSRGAPERKHCLECGGFRFADDRCQTVFCGQFNREVRRWS
jgi:hypothetical protein